MTRPPKLPVAPIVPAAPTTEELAAEIASQLARAKADLHARMLLAGLTRENGWRVSEKLSHPVGGTLWTLRPIHSHEPSPPMEASVLIDEQGRFVRTEGF